MNVDLLRNKMKQKKASPEDVASAAEISRASIYRRLNGSVPFKCKEVRKIADFLELNNKDITSIFFG